MQRSVKRSRRRRLEIFLCLRPRLPAALLCSPLLPHSSSPTQHDRQHTRRLLILRQTIQVPHQSRNSLLRHSSRIVRIHLAHRSPRSAAMQRSAPATAPVTKQTKPGASKANGSAAPAVTAAPSQDSKSDAGKKRPAPASTSASTSAASSSATALPSSASAAASAPASKKPRKCTIAAAAPTPATTAAAASKPAKPAQLPAKSAAPSSSSPKPSGVGKSANGKVGANVTAKKPAASAADDDDELDDIFSRKPAPKAGETGEEDSDADELNAEEDEEESGTAANQATLRRIRARMASAPQGPPPDDLGFTRGGASAAGVKRTAEGYKIYHIDDLGMGKGGDTPLCPFDCQCCF